MKVDLLSGACGAEITGIDLRDTSDGNIKIIKGLLFEHKVIFFRNQDITHQEQIDLSKCFGPIEIHPYVKGIEDHPEILRIIKEPQEQNNWGEGWHSDVSFYPEPTMATILKSIEIPPVGGDTMFANTELAYDTLDKNLKKQIEGKTAIHSSSGPENFLDNYNSMSSNKEMAVYTNQHPIIRTNPDSNRKTLFVNRTFTKQIVGMKKEDSDTLLKKIFDHQERLDFTCRFKWTPNAVAIWDNRSVLHYGIADFFPNRNLGYIRVLDRIAVRGEKPF
tara:strand:+ start:212 stop:1039 length:828 start_codon:yes stop_codon:yes gene_type:complete